MEKIKSKILITGAEGMLGTALIEEAQKKFTVFPTDFKELDITQKEKVKEKFLAVKPEMVIHTAAYTNVDGCEKNPEVAYSVNVNGTRNVSESAKEVGATLIFMSTDYVFDGNKKTPYTEEDLPHPLGVYAKTKLEGEDIVKDLVSRHLIIRSSFLFGKGKKGFVEAILEQARNNKTVKVVCDKYGSPTYAKDLSQGIISLCELMVVGKFNFSGNNILNITNSGFCSWIEYAQKSIEFSKIKGITLLPVRLADYPFRAKRPPFSALDNSKYKSTTGKLLRPWQEALKEYLECMPN